MRIIKIISSIVLAAGLIYAFVEKDTIQQFFQEEEKHENTDNLSPAKTSEIYQDSSDQKTEFLSDQMHPHNQIEDQEVKPFYQGEVIAFEHGGAYTYIEVKEKTDMSFWITVEKADVKLGDYVMFQEEFVAKDFHSDALNKKFEEIMFASNLQYRVSE